MGDKIGQLRAASETTQLAIICGTIGLGGLLWAIGLVGPMLTLLGMFFTIGAYYGMSLLLGSKLEVFEEGFAMTDDGKTWPIGYDELKSIAVKFTHQSVRGRYLGSRAEFTFERERGRPWFRYGCDYRSGDTKERLFENLIRRCSEAIQSKLRHEMNERGMVRWTEEVSMSSQGFVLHRAGAGAPLVMTFDEIEDVQISDDKLRIWHRGNDAQPCFTQQSDTRNFIPLYDLFCILRESPRNQSDTSAASRPTREEPVTALAGR